MTETRWLSVKEASIHCYKMDLPRSTKSLRRWCTKEEVEAQKRKTSHGEKWFIDRESLEIKIKEELEFLKLSEKPFLQPEQSAGHTPDMSPHDRTQADVTGHERSQTDASGHVRTQLDKQSQPQIRDLEDQVLLLKHDIKWRDQALKDQKNANMILTDEVKGQSRYIGHLETNVLGLGGKTDQTFLAAPTPIKERERSEPAVEPEIVPPHRPHPDQGSLHRKPWG